VRLAKRNRTHGLINPKVGNRYGQLSESQTTWCNLFLYRQFIGAAGEFVIGSRNRHTMLLMEYIQ
jgi:hypothetical protein